MVGTRIRVWKKSAGRHGVLCDIACCATWCVVRVVRRIEDHYIRYIMPKVHVYVCNICAVFNNVFYVIKSRLPNYIEI